MGKEDLEDYETEIKENIAEIQKKIESAGKLSGPAKKTATDAIKTSLQKTRHLLKGYVIEIKELSTNEQGLYLDREKEFSAQLGKFDSDIQWMTTAQQQQAGNGQPTVAVVENKKMEDLTAKELTTHALEVQKESKESALRSKQIINNTLAVGQETSNVLKQQTDQIRQIDRNLDQVESNLKRAEMQVRAYVR
eukprot:NODE_354_length_8925_cov_1.106050.p4 type:complete len:193 gc:universal NODE_354_length_8925_cov_1.106050:2813-2235(-)